MKKTVNTLAIFIIIAMVFLPMQSGAQVPEKMSYQAVIRNSSNNLVTNSNIGMQVSILQYTVDGTPVFVERHFPTTNASGLVTLEIGSGTVINGDFTSINWGNGPYFIKTETDLNGGANYTISGTSQLLSVPYALHAKSAEIYSETDPVFSSSLASGINTVDTNNWNNKQDLLTAGKGIDITNNVIRTTTYSVGDFAQGGIVFWIDETGQHGLVCAKTDQDGGSGVRWFAGTYGNTQAKGNGIYAGEANTTIIIASQVSIGDDGSTYAARVCNELQIIEGNITYGDWYLPSRYELTLMFENKAIIDSTANANGGNAINTISYWSSNELDSSYSWVHTFANGSQMGAYKVFLGRVRAIRAF